MFFSKKKRSSTVTTRSAPLFSDGYQSPHAPHVPHSPVELKVNHRNSVQYGYLAPSNPSSIQHTSYSPEPQRVHFQDQRQSQQYQFVPIQQTQTQTPTQTRNFPSSPSQNASDRSERSIRSHTSKVSSLNIIPEQEKNTSFYYKDIWSDLGSQKSSTSPTPPVSENMSERVEHPATDRDSIRSVTSSSYGFNHESIGSSINSFPIPMHHDHLTECPVPYDMYKVTVGKEDYYCLEIELPGMLKNASDKEFVFENQHLIIRAKKRPSKHKPSNYLVQSRCDRYDFAIRLPDDCNLDDYNGHYESGVLTVNIRVMKKNRVRVLKLLRR